VLKSFGFASFCLFWKKTHNPTSDVQLISMKALYLTLTTLLLITHQVWGVEPRLKILHHAQLPNRLHNGELQQVQGEAFSGWSPWQNGYQIGLQVGRNGSHAAYCRNVGNEQSGIGQTVDLNQPAPTPVVVSGWSRAHHVNGGRDSGYAIYVDVIYSDGEPLWGQNAPFDTGTHDWQQERVTIFPTKPIQRVSVYGLFRGHTGEVWFDDFAVYELGGADVTTFDGLPVESNPSVASRESGTIYQTQAGLTLGYHWEDGSVSALQVNDRELADATVPSGFLVRDVAKDSDFYGFNGGKCPPLQLELSAEITAHADHLRISGQIGDTSGVDRAITLVFALPVDATGWMWHDDVRHYRTIQPRQEYINGTDIGTGATGTMSLYPWAVITDDTAGLAIGLDMDLPGQYRISYNAGTRQFFIAYDFGLTPETQNFPSRAPFAFVVYRTDSAWGFRAAAKTFYTLFPDQFRCRSKDQGIWMPFTDVSTVEGWEDFGFKYHEGINSVPFDDTAGILSFRYTEPSTWWVRMPKEVPRTHEGVMQVFEASLHADNPATRRAAQAIQTSGSYDAQGRLQYLVRNEPWCDGAVFSSNPSPYIPGESEAQRHWNEQVKQRLYGPDARGEQDGEYLDSLEGYVTSNENFRREHFRSVTVPLTFSTGSKQPTIHKAFSVYEFTKWLAAEVHGMGKLMFANAVPHRFAFLCPWLDIMGTETNWVRDGDWKPASDNWMNFKRAMCYQKPYLFLMNTYYDRFTPELVEKYFQRCLFYGMYPSMFSHNAAESPYWQAPELYNRDRPLFKRYIPLIKRIAEAGWEPVTYATSSADSIYVERFGPDAQGNVYLTLLNDSAEPQEAIIHIQRDALNVAAVSEVMDILSAMPLPVHQTDDALQVTVHLSAEQTCVLWLPRNIDASGK